MLGSATVAAPAINPFSPALRVIFMAFLPCCVA
jgi:hypothetical protein